MLKSSKKSKQNSSRENSAVPSGEASNDNASAGVNSRPEASAALSKSGFKAKVRNYRFGDITRSVVGKMRKSNQEKKAETAGDANADESTTPTKRTQRSSTLGKRNLLSSSMDGTGATTRTSGSRKLVGSDDDRRSGASLNSLRDAETTAGDELCSIVCVCFGTWRECVVDVPVSADASFVESAVRAAFWGDGAHAEQETSDADSFALYTASGSRVADMEGWCASMVRTSDVFAFRRELELSVRPALLDAFVRMRFAGSTAISLFLQEAMMRLRLDWRGRLGLYSDIASSCAVRFDAHGTVASHGFENGVCLRLVEERCVSVYVAALDATYRILCGASDSDVNVAFAFGLLAASLRARLGNSSLRKEDRRSVFGCVDFRLRKECGAANCSYRHEEATASDADSAFGGNLLDEYALYCVSADEELGVKRSRRLGAADSLTETGVYHLRHECRVQLTLMHTHATDSVCEAAVAVPLDVSVSDLAAVALYAVGGAESASRVALTLLSASDIRDAGDKQRDYLRMDSVLYSVFENASDRSKLRVGVHILSDGDAVDADCVHAIGGDAASLSLCELFAASCVLVSNGATLGDVASAGEVRRHVELRRLSVDDSALSIVCADSQHVYWASNSADDGKEENGAENSGDFSPRSRMRRADQWCLRRRVVPVSVGAGAAAADESQDTTTPFEVHIGERTPLLLSLRLNSMSLGDVDVKFDVLIGDAVCDSVDYAVDFAPSTAQLTGVGECTQVCAPLYVQVRGITQHGGGDGSVYSLRARLAAVSGACTVAETVVLFSFTLSDDSLPVGRDPLDALAHHKVVNTELNNVTPTDDAAPAPSSPSSRRSATIHAVVLDANAETNSNNADGDGHIANACAVPPSLLIPLRGRRGTGARQIRPRFSVRPSTPASTTPFDDVHSESSIAATQATTTAAATYAAYGYTGVAAERDASLAHLERLRGDRLLSAMRCALLTAKYESHAETIVRAQTHWRRVLARMRVARLRKTMAQRDRIAREILDTERSYVSGIKALVSIYKVPLEAASTGGAQGDLISAADLDTIFMNIEDICEENDKLLWALEKRFAEWSHSAGVGDIFLRLANGLTLYERYNSGYQEAQRIFLKKLTEAEFGGFMRAQRLMAADQSSLDFVSLHITPIQRIPRYVMLISQLVKYTPVTHADHALLRRALAQMESIAEDVNESIRAAESAEKMRAVEKKIIGSAESIYVDGRIFVAEGTLDKVCKKGIKPRRFFLFSDVLIYAIKLELGKFNCRRIMRMDELRVDEPVLENNDLGVPLDRAFQIITPAKSFTVVADDVHSRRTWMANLNSVARKARAANASATAVRESLLGVPGIGMGGGASPARGAPSPLAVAAARDDESMAPTSLGVGVGLASSSFRLLHGNSLKRNAPVDGGTSEAPLWVNDKLYSHCMQCKSRFNAMRRRHHCRDCGRLVCGSCSSRKVRLENIGKSVRVCGLCFRRRSGAEAFGDAGADGGFEQREMSSSAINYAQFDFANEWPLRLLTRIFAFLAAPDVCRAYAVCRRWRDAVAQSDELWYALFERDFGDNATPLTPANGGWRQTYQLKSTYEARWATKRCRRWTIEAAHDGAISCACLLSDGSVALSGGATDGSLCLWDVDASERFVQLNAHEGGVGACCVGHGDRDVFLSAGATDAVVKVWDATTGTCQRELFGHACGVSHVECSLNAQWAVSASHDGQILLWDARQGDMVAGVHHHGGALAALRLHCFTLLTAAKSGIVQVWDLRGGGARSVHQFDATSICGEPVALQFDERRILLAGKRALAALEADRTTRLLVEGAGDIRAVQSDRTKVVVADDKDVHVLYGDVHRREARVHLTMRDNDEGSDEAYAASALCMNDGALCVGTDMGALLFFDFAAQVD